MLLTNLNFHYFLRGECTNTSERGIQLSADWQFQSYVIFNRFPERIRPPMVLVKPLIKASIMWFLIKALPVPLILDCEVKHFPSKFSR